MMSHFLGLEPLKKLTAFHKTHRQGLHSEPMKLVEILSSNSVGFV